LKLYRRKGKEGEGRTLLKELIYKSRSYRRFDESITIDPNKLRQWVDLGRLSPSGANRQPLKYILSTDPVMNQKIFPTLSWAGYLKDWPGPKEGERPTAYIVILGDRNISQSFGCDHGIAAQSILLGATEDGYGGCMIGMVDRPVLSQILQIPEQFEILLVIALGKPKETVIIEPAGEDIRYWRSEDGVHHVPKRSLDEIILRSY